MGGGVAMVVMVAKHEYQKNENEKLLRGVL